MDLGLNGKTALVLGGGGGLGKVIAATLAREGASVAIADIDERAAASAAEPIVAQGGTAMPFGWDLGALDGIDERVSSVESQLGSIDILINITGGPPPTPVAGQPLEAWEKHFRSMVASVIAITDRVLPEMRRNRWGRIVTSTSSGVVAPIVNLGLSNALRLSLVGWSKTLSRVVGRDGVTANVIVPGRIATGRITFLDEQKAKREGRSVEEVAAASAADIGVGRYGDPQEYADVVAFLASRNASYVTGSVVRVDGGLIASI